MTNLLYRERRREKIAWIASAIIGLSILWRLSSDDITFILYVFFLIVQIDTAICPFKDAFDAEMLQREIDSINKANRSETNDKNTPIKN